MWIKNYKSTYKNTFVRIFTYVFYCKYLYGLNPCDTSGVKLARLKKPKWQYHKGSFENISLNPFNNS